MATTEKYTTVIELNSEQAKRNLDELRRKVESWKNDLAEAREKKMGRSFINAIMKELKDAEKELKKYDNEVARTIDTMNNLQSASVERIEDAQKNLLRLSKEVPQDSSFYEKLNGMLDQVTQELDNIKATKAFEEMQKAAVGATKSAELLKAELHFVEETAKNAETASVRQLQLAERTAESIKYSAQQGSEEWDKAGTGLERIRERLDRIQREEHKAVSLVEQYNRELEKVGKESDKVTKETELIDRTLGRLSHASIVDLEYSIKTLNEEMRHMDRSSDEYREAEKKVKRLRTELEQTRRETGAQQSAWGKFIGFFNRNWGVITQGIGAVTGLSMTIRRAVQDFAEMEEEMADVRKYTGLTADQVRDLNEALKKMDTRTSREELNQLAGAAGRLGISERDDILEFVDAADKIKVALGDDLGEGAVDQIGKLAMAFGEDEHMGLRGAMLATGSAVNELAQNSSAKAGYLVDFTARVAGFGKQLGLTQAQIMGFGAVMDENLLRDEMAATAFGNMLTKMQTDTATFARIAGKDVKEFTDLLNRDANAAVLALADSLRSADPQNMMKMLDGMGLDGSRAVAVIATLADKIDDVRQHQERATKAYEEGTSVSKEFETMNNTVQARLDKVKKRFHEMTVELGEKLLPVVSLTISGAGMMAKGLSVLTSFVQQNWKCIAVLTTVLMGLTLAWNANSVAMRIATAYETVSMALHKAHVFVMTTYKQAVIAVRIAVAALSGNVERLNALLRLSNKIGMVNPWVALATAITALGVAIWGSYEAWKSHKKAIEENLQSIKEMRAVSKLQSDIRKESAKSTAEERTRIEQLTKVIRSNVYSVDERRAAVRKLQAIVPDYHASISREGQLFNENTDAIKTYIENLNAAAMAEAVYAKKVEINKKRLDAQQREQRIRGSLKAVDAERQAHPEKYNPKEEQWVDYDGRVHTQTVRTKDGIENDRQKKIHQRRLADVQSEQKVIDAEDRSLDKLLEKDKKLNQHYTQMLTRNDTQGSPVSPNKPTGNVPEEEKKGHGKHDEKDDSYEDELKTLETVYKRRQLILKSYLADGRLTEREYQDQSFLAEMEHLKEKVQLQQNYGKDIEDTQLQILDKVMAQAKVAQQRSAQAMQEELNTAEDAYNADRLELARQRNEGVIATDKEYQQRLKEQELDYLQQRLAIIRRFGGDTLQAEQAIEDRQLQDVKEFQNQMKQAYEKAYSQADTLDDQRMYARMMYDQQLIDFEDYQQRMTDIEEREQQHRADVRQQFFQMGQQLLSAYSAYAQACSDLDTAKITADYDRQIEAAGKNSRKRERLEKERDEKLRKAKTKSNERAMRIEIAQALATTAANALAAYGAVLQPQMPWTVPLAVAAAAAATVNGMLQVATIKKQHQAEAAGYYEGGFTGGRRYRREAGVVHEGEFVANHQAVNNPAIVPFLNFLDQAQRNNTVGSLSMQDVSRQLVPNAAVMAPVVNVQAPDNSELHETLHEAQDVLLRLAVQLEQGIGVDIPIDGENGIYRKLRRYEEMIKNK